MASGGILTLDSAAAALDTSRLATSRRLSALARTGWLSRVRRGVYSIRPIDASPGTKIAEEDPWTLAMRIFPPCYLGGWTAAGHWHLTEQLFRVTLVVTTSGVRRANVTIGSTAFHVARDSRGKLSGLSTVWRGNARVLVSSVERTLVDACAHPSWVGGGGQLVSIFRSAVEDARMTPESLLREVRGATSGAALGRIGVLVERYWPKASTVSTYAAKHRGTGYVRFDPAVKRNGRLNRRWGIWLNVTLAETAG